jgi:NifU-like protein involved in Fe-S cluster formation
MNNGLGYPDTVWRLFRETPRMGRIDGAVVADAVTPGSGFRLRLELRRDGGRIADAAFQAHGCPYAIATGAWLADALIGQPVTVLADPPIARLRAELEIPEERAHCWLMAQDVLRDLHRQCPP